MAISFAASIIVLMLMLVFVFVGIGAFSPNSSFSSVTNSLLPLGAGAAVNKKPDDDKDDAAQKAEDIVTI